MTAEIALLNKTSVALAADSAATLSDDDRDQKVFNSEDKLFELSNTQPIGVMIYSSTNFMETPLHLLIKSFRSENRTFSCIDDAATAFRDYLCQFGRSLDDGVKKRSLSRIIGYPIDLVRRRIHNARKRDTDFSVDVSGNKAPDDIKPAKFDFDTAFQEAVTFYTGTFEAAKPCQYIGAKPKKIKFSAKDFDPSKGGLSTEQMASLVQLTNLFLAKAAASNFSSGIVIAGFGTTELFPSLRSFEIDGIFDNSLRYMNADNHDITHDGARAAILPYAQQQMVDRFVTGIDEYSQTQIETYSRRQLFALHERLFDIMDIEDKDSEAYLKGLVRQAEGEYLKGLREDSFAGIREKARLEMESMVEFMPKSDLAQMAESLVELTSIKRRVSKGFETVGGPIDVAVISRSDGFVWIKRKHYFPPELNARFFERVSRSVQEGGRKHGDGKQPASPRKRARGSPSTRPGTAGGGGPPQDRTDR